MSKSNGAPFINPNPTLGIAKALAEEKEKTDARQKLLDKQHTGEHAGSDASLSGNQRHDYTGEADAKKKNFDQKKYLFPDSYNALRKELEDYYPNFFTSINPHVGTSPAYAMVFDAPQFVGLMNGAFDLAVQFDSENVDGICKTFLNAARIKRGVKPFAED